MQGVVAAGREHAIDVNQVLHAADFGAKNDLIAAQSVFFRQRRRTQRALHHGIHGDLTRVFHLLFRQARVLIHHFGEKLLVERTPVHPDAHRLLIAHRHLDHGAEIFVVFFANAAISGINAVFAQRFSARGILGEQDVSVVMEIAYNGHAHILFV